jgi:hypothetical protein
MTFQFCPSADPSFVAPMPRSAMALTPGDDIRMMNYVVSFIDLK